MEDPARKTEKDRQLAQQEGAAHQHERKQEVSAGHRRGHHPFDQFADAHFDDYKPDTPQSAGHEVEPKQAWNQKIYVTRARLADGLVLHRRRISASLGSLQRVVHHRPGHPAFGPGRIELIDARRPCGSICPRKGSSRREGALTSIARIRVSLLTSTLRSLATEDGSAATGFMGRELRSANHD